MSAVLEAQGLTKRFGGLLAVDRFDLVVNPGEVVSLIGPNGAGKTTVFNMLSGISAPDEGRILIADRDAAGWSSWRVLRAGVARIFQNPRVFRRLTVLDNVAVTTVGHTSPWHELRSLFSRDPERRHRAEEVLDRVGLRDRSNELAGNLSYGNLRRLEIARALAADPRLILLDEPSAGMTPREVDDLSGLILELRKTGISLLVIEHNMVLVGDVSDRLAVLNFGQKIAEGKPAEVRADPRVIEAYLGGVGAEAV